ncbi:hypothetical protein [Actinospongicola halichondriae]|uniref:hypothetical protein n=1 Tax=Actinospongicola halichondriae TaxID=3236844 RepID=UPI003D4E6547
MTKTWWIAALVSAGLMVGACGGDDDAASDDVPAAEPDDGADAPDLDLGSDGVTIEQGDNSVTVSGLGIPDGFPDSVWLPEDYEVLSAQEQDDGGSVAWILLGSVAGPPDDVASDLIDHYGEPDSREDPSDSTILEWTGRDGHDLSFTLQANADGDTVLTVSVQVS